MMRGCEWVVCVCGGGGSEVPSNRTHGYDDNTDWMFD